MRIRSCFLLALLLGAGHSLSADVLYSVTDLGNLGPFAVGRGINNSGQVTGDSSTSTSSAAFLYSNGQVTDLGTLGGTGYSSGWALNDAGQVAGDSYASFSRAFLYSNGQMNDLGTLGGSDSAGRGINNAGQVTGSADTSSGAFHAFLYSNGQMIDLGTLGGSYSMGTSINNAGQITGFASTSIGVGHAFLYSNGQMVDLGSLGTSNLSVGSSNGHAINNLGQVTGESSSLLHESTHAFLYSNGQMVDLGSLTGTGGNSDGYSINDEGQVTGYSSVYSGGSHAFLYSNGQMMDLNDLIDPALGITLREGTGINDHGQIVANGYGAQGRGVYILTPVPEPSTWALLGIPFLVLLVWSRRSQFGR